MSGVINLAGAIRERLPAELVDFLRQAGEAAQKQGQGLYLVGGIVRDLLLGRTNLDVDLVVEGDAIALARELADSKQGEITVHHRFGTAKVSWDSWSVDIATARAETYAKPGALPTVKSGSIDNDLFRRDFTINAMAVELNKGSYGKLLDLYGGRDDLEHKLVRVLHEKSFIDDATRLWRGLRYEQRLGFRLEPDTLKLVKRDIPMLDTISGDRIRHELELVLREEFPERALRRADELGVLARLHSSLQGDSWLAEKFAGVRKLTAPTSPSVALYLILLAYRLSGEEAEQLILYLRLPRLVARALRDTLAVKAKMESLAVPGLAPSRIHALLHGYASTSLTANLLAVDAPTAAEHIALFLDVLCHVSPALSGEDLKRLGVPLGPGIKEMLDRLRTARLDGKVKNRKEEEEMVRGWGIRQIK